MRLTRQPPPECGFCTTPPDEIGPAAMAFFICEYAYSAASPPSPPSGPFCNEFK
ncbi:hypothetical protein ENSA5_58840 [Enhygromyxa salina]|uniref:Uncharacterized protein n=1 Tax=Enhygromyxa salina TaxID=215803 RepID=A0A2S9XDY8_9BACT|nr:hypothetical protein ENSA5_58840 [Enhygromyxa salina]